VWLQMKPESRSTVYALMGVGSIVLGGYTLRQAVTCLRMSGDSFGAALLGLAGIGLVLVAAAHLYMAAGYRFGRLDAVTGSGSTATLWTRSGMVANGVRISLVRKPDADNLSAKSVNRYVFFVGDWKPWVCPESEFLRE
jgi:hypothetical protein